MWYDRGTIFYFAPSSLFFTYSTQELKYTFKNQLQEVFYYYLILTPKKMLKWPACCQWYCILCFLYCFTNQFRSSSMTTMYKLLKHPLRLHFFNSGSYQQNIAPRISQHWQNISVNATRDLFTLSRCWQKFQHFSVGDCGCCIELKLQLIRIKISVEVFRRHITLAFDKHETTLPQTYGNYKSIQRKCCDENNKTN